MSHLSILSGNNTLKTFLFALLLNVRENCINKDYNINKERSPLKRKKYGNKKLKKEGNINYGWTNRQSI